jgi:hypothetical protein
MDTRLTSFTGVVSVSLGELDMVRETSSNGMGRWVWADGEKKNE